LVTRQLKKGPGGHQQAPEFERAAEQRSPGIIGEFIGFLSYSKKWWLAPIIIVMLLGLFVVLGGTGFEPFIYTLF
jgi:hypothetical protein